MSKQSVMFLLLSILSTVAMALEMPSLVSIKNAEPTQTFFIPMPENDVFYDMFRKINDHKDDSGQYVVRGKMVSLVSLAVSTDKTVIWYDHWEDEFEDNVLNPKAASTEVWGDGDASNGCRPDIPNCSDEDDYLNAGDSFVITSDMAVPRTKNTWFHEGYKFDGSDRLQTSYPVTLTRGMYPEAPGSLLAGAVEIHDQSKWGTSYTTPVGTNTPSETDAFEYTRLFVMSATDGNTVTLPDGQTATLDIGESLSVSVLEGDEITASDPVQVDLVTGDIDSYFELRWFSLLPTAEWGSDYISPVGDTYGRTKLLIFNPSTNAINVSFKTKEVDQVLVLPAKSSMFSPIVPYGSAAKVFSNHPFSAMSITDAELYVDTGDGLEYLGGRYFDWGCPLIPREQLTTQVLVGWGFGCTNNDCDGKTDRSAVFVAPEEDANIYIDFQNTGGNYDVIPLKKFESTMIRDSADHDMSGAIIFATRMSDNSPNGTPVKIASAWGQDPSVSRNDQDISLDLGTAVLPFSSMRVTMKPSRGKAKPGDTIYFTVDVLNVGQVDAPPGYFNIKSDINPPFTYVPGKSAYRPVGTDTWIPIPDDTVGDTPCPYDEGGLPSIAIVDRRGGAHEYRYMVQLDPEIDGSIKKIPASITVTPGNGKSQKIDLSYPVRHPAAPKTEPRVQIDSKVYVGDYGADGCPNSVNNIVVLEGETITFCYRVKNTGATYLNNFRFSDVGIGIGPQDVQQPDWPIIKNGKWAPNPATVVIRANSTYPSKNMAVVVATPVDSEGVELGFDDVTDNDPAWVRVESPDPEISVTNVVFPGRYGPIGCETAATEKVTGMQNEGITFCFSVKNTGNTYLTGVSLSVPTLDDFLYLEFPDVFAPGDSHDFTFETVITDTVVNVATVKATPIMGDLRKLEGFDTIISEHASEIEKSETMSSKGTHDPTYVPDKCVEDNWKDNGNNDNLVCNTKKIYLDKIVTSTVGSCLEGDTMMVSATGSLNFNDPSFFDVGWFVALDGGNAQTGTCSIGALTVGYEGKEYPVTKSADDDTVVGHVSWDAEQNGAEDICGDVFLTEVQSGNVEVVLLQNQIIRCLDEDGDGKLDFMACFSWRSSDGDEICTLNRDADQTAGSEADLYPSSTSNCFCDQYDLPDIEVIKPTPRPTRSPIAAPSSLPSFTPSVAPTSSPTVSTSVAPSASPSSAPSSTPTKSPTSSPSKAPSVSPSSSLSNVPTSAPSAAPTSFPTVTSSLSPSASPSSAPSADPTKSPTFSPMKVPSASPSSSSSNVPTSAPSTEVKTSGDTRSGVRPGGGGDPHFKTWSGHKFDYHGECDLVLVDNPSFADGLGLTVHIRTTRRRFFSYIERAALRIGQDVLEFVNNKDWYLNGIMIHSDAKIGGYEVWRFPRAISVRLNKAVKAKIDFIVRKNGMPYIVFDDGDTDVYKGSLGMMGNWTTGNMAGRDGHTLIEDPNEFAREWQVRDTDPHLFMTMRAPQYPSFCIEPEKTVPSDRLGGSIMKKVAEKACKKWGDDIEECIFDVMASRDLRAAESVPMVG